MTTFLILGGSHKLIRVFFFLEGGLYNQSKCINEYDVIMNNYYKIRKVKVYKIIYKRCLTPSFYS